MGSCVSSVSKNPDSTMNIKLWMTSKKSKVVIPSSQFNNTITHVISFNPQSSPAPPPAVFPDPGSKEESFFDSQAWLESDCDDDFLSVNGDFTPSRGNSPSRGNTPNHQSGLSATQLNRSLFANMTPNLKPEASPTDKKKRLSELFQEGFDVDEKSDEQTRRSGKLDGKKSKFGFQSKPASVSPYLSGTNSGYSSARTPNGNLKQEKEKISRNIQCCLPSFAPSRKSSATMSEF